MVIETEELFNHGIEGERHAGESLLARASVTDFKFHLKLDLAHGQDLDPTTKVVSGTSLLPC